MKDLNKRIAELKGWEYDPVDFGWFRTPEEKKNGQSQGELVWTGSDADALDLVDEIQNAMFFFERFGTGVKTWRAVFSFRGDGSTWKDFEGRSQSRPEAICKAYIAAREWMVTKAAEDAWRKGEEAKDKAWRSGFGA